MYYNIHNLVHIKVFNQANKSLTKSIDFQISYFKQDTPSKSVDIEIRSYSDFSGGDLEIFHFFSGQNGKLYHNPKTKFAIDKDSGKFVLYTDHPNFLVNLFIQMVMKEHGFSFIHSAGVTNGNKSFIFPGAGGVGKTALLSSLVKNDGYKVLGDDLLLASEEGYCLSFPREFVLKEYHKDDYSDIFKEKNIKHNPIELKRFILTNLPFADFLKSQLKKYSLHHAIAEKINLSPYCATVPVEEIFGEGSISDQANNPTIILLSRNRCSDFSLKTIDENDLASNLFSTIHHEWHEFSQLMFSAGALNLWDLAKYYQDTQQIIRAFVKGKKILKLEIPEHATSTDVYAFFKKEIHGS